MKNSILVSFLLRIGLGAAFLYAAIASFLEPESWIGFFPIWLRNLAPANYLLMTFSIYEIILAIWLFSSKKIFYAASLATLTLAGIIVFNISTLDIIFRDIPILFLALALMVIHKEASISA